MIEKIISDIKKYLTENNYTSQELTSIMNLLKASNSIDDMYETLKDNIYEILALPKVGYFLDSIRYIIENNINFKGRENELINIINNRELFKYKYKYFRTSIKPTVFEVLHKSIEIATYDDIISIIKYLIELQNFNDQNLKNKVLIIDDNTSLFDYIKSLFILDFDPSNLINSLESFKNKDNINFKTKISELKIKNKIVQEENKDSDFLKIKKEFPSFNDKKIYLIINVLKDLKNNNFRNHVEILFAENTEFNDDNDTFNAEESQNLSRFLLKQVYNNEKFIKYIINSYEESYVGSIFDKIFFLIIKDKNLFDKYSYLLISTSLNSGNFNYMNKLINLKRFIPSFKGIKAAIIESIKPIPSKIFGLLFNLPINEINEIYSQKKKLIKTNLINLNNFPILKELYDTNNQILQLIISEYSKFASSIEELLKDYLTNNSKTPESLYNEVFKKDPTYLNKIVSLIKYKAPYISEFNSLNIKSNAQNIQQYIKIKLRQTDLAALIHNQEINNNLVPMLFNNSKLDLKEPYIDNLVSVINFSNNKKEKINKFIQIQNKFKQKGFDVNIQEFLDQLKESEKYIDEFETNNLNPSPRFIQLFKELATHISYVEMSDQINNYIRIAEKKDPNLFKLELNFDGYEFKVLKDLDPTHFRIGIDTDCCQRIGGAGSEAAIDSFINSQAGVLVLYHNSNILAQSYFHFVPEDNGFILDNIEYNKTEVQKIDKNIKDNQSLVLTEIYKKYAELLKEKYPEIKYLKLGKEQTKILTQEFKESELEEDPRRFKVDDPYTDFDESDHVDLF